MTKTLEAVVRGNALYPLQKLDLPEDAHVLVTVVPLGQGNGDVAATCYDAALRLGAIGVAKDTPADLSTNTDHLDGFGA
jgi:hypothetical protein